MNRLIPIVLIATTFATTSPAVPNPAPPQSTQPQEISVEVRYTDDSTMKLKVLDEKLEFVTKYGVLQLKVADINKIEFATRSDPKIAAKVSQAISKLNSSEFSVREAATKELKGCRTKAYPQVLKATKSDDPETGRRAEEVIKNIQFHVPANLLQFHPEDTVYIGDSKILGKFSAEFLRVKTFQFGDQELRLGDSRSLRMLKDIDDTPVAAMAPGNLSTYASKFGQELRFTVSGTVPGPGATPNIWGTDVYTLDSSLSVAAVHAGVVKSGETAVVVVRIVQSPQQFGSSFRNGVTSIAYGHYPSGAYEFLRP